MVLEKTLKNPLDSKEIKPVNPKGNQPWIFTGRTDAEAEVPILWPPDGKNRLIGKDLDADRDWGQDENGVTEKDDWMASVNQWSLSLSKEVEKDREAWHAAVHEVQRVRHNNNFCMLILYLVILLNLLMLTFLGGVYGIFYLGKDFCCHLVNSVDFLFYLSSLWLDFL